MHTKCTSKYTSKCIQKCASKYTQKYTQDNTQDIHTIIHIFSLELIMGCCESRNNTVMHDKKCPTRYTPDQNTSDGFIELFYESDDPDTLNMPDNITIAPWGDIIISEDTKKYLMNAGFKLVEKR